MTQTSTGIKFQKAWTFPEPVEKRIAKFVSLHPGKWLHAPVGISKIFKGESFPHNVEMITLDSDASVKPDVVGDIFNLKDYFDYKFDGVISDPVWLKYETCKHCGKPTTREVGLAYPQRRKLSYSVRDILAPGGWWVFNGLWDPSIKGLDITPNDFCESGVEIPRQEFNSYRNLPYLAYLQRQNEVLDFG